MRTLKTRAADVAALPATASIDNFIGTPEERAKVKKKKSSPGSRRKEYIAEVEQRVISKDWTGMTAGKLIALYFVCHVKVYGIEPAELNRAATWETAMMAAGGMVRDHFEGDVQVAIKFIRWTWTRENEKEQWRRKNDKGGRRITWVNQFRHDYLVSDWRAEKMRKLKQG